MLPFFSPAAREEWAQLDRERAWLAEAFAWLRAHVAAPVRLHREFRGRLAAYRRALAAWRERYATELRAGAINSRPARVVPLRRVRAGSLLAHRAARRRA